MAELTEEEKKRKKDKEDEERVKLLKAGDDKNEGSVGKAAEALLRNRKMKEARARQILLNTK